TEEAVRDADAFRESVRAIDREALVEESERPRPVAVMHRVHCNAVEDDRRLQLVAQFEKLGATLLVELLPEPVPLERGEVPQAANSSMEPRRSRRAERQQSLDPKLSLRRASGDPVILARCRERQPELTALRLD